MATPADEEMIGRNVAGKFLVETFLGGGAMGAVYMAYQKSIEKHVAIKVLHRQFVTDANFVLRFEREAKAASLLDHANLMRVMDYGREPDGVCYIAMELLTGRSLFQLLKEDGRISDQRIAGLIRQTLAGLAVAHEQGIIHRDLKPENIIVLERSDDDGKKIELVKVCDFGMAKMVTPETEVGGPLSSEKLTSHGVVVGTPDYMSPEQGKGERLDARSDLYAVGVILYQMLTGRLPFTAETPIATLLRHVVEEPLPPSAIEPNVHPGLEAVCLRALSKRRDDRYQTAREMRADIRAMLDGGSMPSAIPPPRSALGSIQDTDLAAFDLRPPPVPKSLGLPPMRPAMQTPPASHRIRALEAVAVDEHRGRSWKVPLVVGLLVAVAGAGLFAARQRRHGVASVAVTTHDIPSTLEAAHAAAPPETGAAQGAAPPVTTAGVMPAADPRAPQVSYNAPPAATLVKGARAEASTPAPPASAAGQPAGPAFGVLAVPEVPKIAGAAASSPAASSPAAPTAAAPTAADPFDHARVVLGAIHGDKVAGGDVAAAMPTARFDRCYKKGLAAHGGPVGGQGSLHLAIDAAGHIGSASFAGTADLASVGQCIADAAIGRDVKHVEAGVTGADIDLAFRPE